MAENLKRGLDNLRRRHQPPKPDQQHPFQQFQYLIPPLAAVRDGAPQAIQCADRWHLWHNLAEHVLRAVTGHHHCLKQAISSVHSAASADNPQAVCPDTAVPEPPAAADADEQHADEQAAGAVESVVVTRIRQRYAAIAALQAEGHGLREIARQLDLDRKTVRRFTQATSADELVAKTLERDTLLDRHKPYLHQRWNQGCQDVTILHAEVRQRGYRGSIRTLYRYLQPLRVLDSGQTAAPVRAAAPKIRHVSTWLLRRPEDLTDTEQATLAAVRGVCSQLDRLGGHITAFAKMMVHRTGADTLDTWLATVEADDIAELHTFARGIRQDYTAVRNGLSLPYNSGACEGAVNKLKTVKRQMYGRASFSLLFVWPTVSEQCGSHGWAVSRAVHGWLFAGAVGDGVADLQRSHEVWIRSSDTVAWRSPLVMPRPVQ